MRKVLDKILGLTHPKPWGRLGHLGGASQRVEKGIRQRADDDSSLSMGTVHRGAPPCLSL